MNNIQIFHFNKLTVRIINDNLDEPLFVAFDVATALGYAKPENAVRRHCNKATPHPKQGVVFTC